MDELAQLAYDISRSIDDANKLNAEGRPTRSRQLSLVITKLEEAMHWLNAVERR